MTVIEERIRQYARSYYGQRQPYVALACGWITYMGRVYGPTVDVIGVDREHVSTSVRCYGYDWGQALMHEQFGPAWGSHAQCDDLPNAETWQLALRWAQGQWPDWAARPQVVCPSCEGGGCGECELQGEVDDPRALPWLDADSPPSDTWRATA